MSQHLDLSLLSSPSSSPASASPSPRQRAHQLHGEWYQLLVQVHLCSIEDGSDEGNTSSNSPSWVPVVPAFLLNCLSGQPIVTYGFIPHAEAADCTTCCPNYHSSGRLLSIRNSPSYARAIHVNTNGKSSFFCTAEYYFILYVCVYITFYLFLSIDGHLHDFHILAIMNNAAMHRTV